MEKENCFLLYRGFWVTRAYLGAGERRNGIVENVWVAENSEW